jgi:SAM-dependent methyltransferase
MKSHRLTEEYTKAFNAFLDHTTEKRDLFAALKRRIQAACTQSLLDIGAGNGDLALPLSRLVDSYLAIEPNVSHAAKLRLMNLLVFQVSFPWKTMSTMSFDMVLASHVIPWDVQESYAFFCTAWQSVNPNGRFIMITYDEEKSAWGRLLTISGLPIENVGQGHLEGYKKLLASRGALEVEEITTYVQSVDLETMMLALSFVYSDGQPEPARRFRASKLIRGILKSKYCVDGVYRFPFTHYLLEARKRG